MCLTTLTPLVTTTFLTSCNFSLNNDIQIVDSTETEQVAEIQYNFAEFIIKGFHYDNVQDIGKLTVTTTFSEFGTYFYPYITNVDTEAKTFDVLLDVYNISTELNLYGFINFYYDGQIVSHTIWQEYHLQLTYPEEPVWYISEPKFSDVNFDMNEKSSSVKLNGYYFIGVGNPNKITISIEKTFVVDGLIMQAAIEDWDPINQTFSVKLSAYNMHSNTANNFSNPNIDRKITLSFFYNGEEILSSKKEMEVNLNYPISQSSLNITDFRGLKTLRGLASGATILPVNDTISVANDINQISNSAFANFATQTQYQNIQHLFFSTGESELFSIGSSAFENDTALKGNLLLPQQLMNVGANAFKNCSGFNQRLSIYKSTQTIGNSAFEGTSFNVIDLSSFNTIPEWATRKNNNIFLNVNPQQGGTVLVSPETALFWQNYLYDEYCGLSSNWKVVC